MRAWATLLTQPDYVPGVRVLAHSLRRSGSTHPLVVMVTPGMDPATHQLLADDGLVVREVRPVGPDSRLPASYANARFAQVWTKLAAWSLTEYERLVVLDADMLVVSPMDELFELPLPEGGIAACHACRCNPQRIPTYPASWVPENCAYTHGGGGHGAADPYLNGGFLVVEPSAAAAAELLARVDAIDDLTRYPFAEQDFLNEHYRGRWRALPYVYNALKTLPFQHPDLWDLAEVRNIHYIIDKPWEGRLGPGERHAALHALWWEAAGQVPGLVEQLEAAAEPVGHLG